MKPASPIIDADFSRGSVLSDRCPSRKVLTHVTSRWGILLLVALKDGQNHRFSDLRRTIKGISEKMLVASLQHLESDGFVLRTPFPVTPPHVEYSLTPMGMEIASHVVTLVDYIEGRIFDILDAQENYRAEKASPKLAERKLVRPGHFCR